MDSPEWVSILISGVLAVAGSYAGNMAISRKKAKEDVIKEAVREQKQADTFKSIEEKISRLEKKVDIHNGYAEKFGEISKSLIAIKKDIEYLRKEKA